MCSEMEKQNCKENLEPGKIASEMCFEYWCSWSLVTGLLVSRDLSTLLRICERVRLRIYSHIRM